MDTKFLEELLILVVVAIADKNTTPWPRHSVVSPLSSVLIMSQGVRMATAPLPTRGRIALAVLLVNWQLIEVSFSSWHDISRHVRNFPPTIFAP